MLLLALTALAQPCIAEPDEPLTVSLATVAPGDILFASMGHSALVFSGGDLKEPVQWDWGTFDPSEATVERFLRGDLPYQRHKMPYAALLAKAQRQDRTLVLDRLDLTPATTKTLLDSLSEGPFSYHWELQNCSTMARDVINEAANNRLSEALQQSTPHTARFEATRHLWRWPIPAFAWRFITSGRLDRPLTEYELAMVPERLHEGVASLTTTTCTAHEGKPFAPAEPPAEWPWALPGLVGSAAVLLTKNRRARGALVSLYGLVLTLLGTSSFVLWAVSSVDGIGPTQNWVLAGPQSVLLLAAGLALVSNRAVWLTKACPILALLGTSVLLFDLIPGVLAVNGSTVAALLPGLLATSFAAWQEGRADG